MSKLILYGNGVVGYKCPGCKSEHILHINPYPNQPIWEFNGDMDKPTFRPSVRVLTGWDRICHSFITDGVIQYLSDCTHELANQSVEIPDN